VVALQKSADPDGGQRRGETSCVKAAISPLTTRGDITFSVSYREMVFGTHSICSVSFCDVHLRGGGG